MQRCKRGARARRHFLSFFSLFPLPHPLFPLHGFIIYVWMCKGVSECYSRLFNFSQWKNGDTHRIPTLYTVYNWAFCDNDFPRRPIFLYPWKYSHPNSKSKLSFFRSNQWPENNFFSKTILRIMKIVQKCLLSSFFFSYINLFNFFLTIIFKNMKSIVFFYLFFCRHLYIPIVEMGYGKQTASLTVFFISAFFHEYLVSVPLKTFKVWAFLGMMGQVRMFFFRPFKMRKKILYFFIEVNKWTFFQSQFSGIVFPSTFLKKSR